MAVLTFERLAEHLCYAVTALEQLPLAAMAQETGEQATIREHARLALLHMQLPSQDLPECVCCHELAEYSTVA